MNLNFSVQIEKFAERHFIKSFEKKYLGCWDVTLKAIIGEFERIDNFLLTNRAETICDKNGLKIIKSEFRVHKTPVSAKASGNRCIVAMDTLKRSVKVLLVYSKTDIPGHNETAEWQKIIRGNYPEFADFFI